MTILLALLIGCLAVPFSVEWMRRPMTRARQELEAPGKLAALPQGVTHYDWYGPANGKIAVCIHGLSTPSFVWEGMTKGLAMLGYRVLVYDHFGRGFSDTVRGVQDAEFFIQNLNDLLAHEDVTQKITLIGYSMGGAIAAHYAAAHPDRVARVALLAPAGMRDITTPLFKRATQWPVIGDWIFLAAYPIVLRRGIVQEAELPSSVPGIHELMALETERRGYFPAMLSSLRGVLSHPAEEAHRAIAAAGVPVLAIWGETDDLIPVAPCRAALEGWNPYAAQSVIEQAGHGLTYTHTDKVLAVLGAWLR